MKAMVIGLALLPLTAAADEVILKGGGRLSGVVVERSASMVVLEVGPGRVGLPLSRVERIVAGTADLATHRERAARLAADDDAGWLELAAWADAHGLRTQAREAFEHVLFIDPGNATAHRAVGHIAEGDRWLTVEESRRAHGYVFFEGEWVMPEARDTALRERAAQDAAVREAGAAEARLAEAEARVREAEARAREAEAQARRTSEANGEPWNAIRAYNAWGLPVTPVVVPALPPCCVATTPCCAAHCPGTVATPPTTPAPNPRHPRTIRG